MVEVVGERGKFSSLPTVLCPYEAHGFRLIMDHFESRLSVTRWYHLELITSARGASARCLQLLSPMQSENIVEIMPKLLT